MSIDCVTIVAGGASGLGEAISHRLAAEGATVARISSGWIFMRSRTGSLDDASSAGNVVSVTSALVNARSRRPPPGSRVITTTLRRVVRAVHIAAIQS